MAVNFARTEFYRPWDFPPPPARNPAGGNSDDLDSIQPEHILNLLRGGHWVIGGRRQRWRSTIYGGGSSRADDRSDDNATFERANGRSVRVLNVGPILALYGLIGSPQG